tara:strand:- start:6946 stop:7461 length:516 start_codon:yes stop_codon:yes gene_type:complete
MLSSNTYNSTQVVGSQELYNIVLNSNDATVSGTDYLFSFDWSVIPDGNYLVHFSFNTATVNTVANPQIAMIYTTALSGSNTFVATNTAGRASAQSSYFLGVAYPYIVSTTSTLHAEDSTNPPIFLNTRPRTNQFSVSVLTNASAPTAYPSLPAWVLVLQLRPFDGSIRKQL